MKIHDHPIALWLRELPLLAAPGWFTGIAWAVYGCGLLLMIVRHCVGPGASRSSRIILADSTMLCVQAIVLVVARLPCLAFEFELQQDESQMAAQAITLLQDPVFYASVDGGSGGPLVSYVLWLPRLLGQEIDYFTARMTGLLLWWLTVVGLFLTVRRTADTLAADVATWAATAVYALAAQIDFMSYQSELLPAALVSWGSFCLFRLPGASEATVGRWSFLLGLICGALPFAKLQAGPIGVMLAALGYAAVFCAGAGRAGCWRAAAGLTAGGIAMPVFFTALFCWAGVFNRFLWLYLGYGMSYTAAGSAHEGLLFGYPRLPLVDREVAWDGLAFALAVTATISAVAAARSGRIPGGSRFQALVAAGVVLATACFVACAPGRCYRHYLTLTIQPAGLVLGLLLAKPQGAGAGRRGAVRAVQAAVVVGAITLAAAWPWATGRPTARQLVVHRPAYEEPRAVFPALDPLLRLCRPGDRLATWGWQASYHVYAGLPQGWLGAGTVMVMRQPGLTPQEGSMVVGDSDQLRDLKRLYLESFQRNRPRFVIDATGPNAAMFRDRARFGLHVWPELAAIIARDYRLIFTSEVDRLYLRIER